MRENTDFYLSVAIGIRHQNSPTAGCCLFAADGLIFPTLVGHLALVGLTVVVIAAPEQEMGTVSETLTLRFATAVSALALAALAVLALEARQASAQEFDCRNAEMASERTICRSNALAALDEKMSSLYAEVKQSYGRRADRNQLQRYQRQFLAARDGCARDTECIKGAYLDQISVLEAQLERNDRRAAR